MGTTYPERWQADVVLADGGTMAVRPIRPDDARLILEFHERQSPESIYFRYFSPRPHLSEKDVERFTHVDYVDRMAFIGLLGDQLVGVARYDRHRARSDAEVAFFIDDAHHGRGMATVLLEYLAAAAREAGISGFTASVLPQNRRMLGVFAQAGFTQRSHFEDGVVEVELGIEPTPEALAAIEARAATAEARSVERLLRPSSIGVVGASRRPGTIGHQVFHQLVRHGFEGPVYPVNRDATFVASVRAWESVVDVPGELDLAIICVPADEVMGVVAECAVKRVHGLLIISSGFADAGPEGDERERELVAYARRHGMRLIGPSALGVINTDPAVSMHGTFAEVRTLPGRVSLMSQSGVIGAAVIDAATDLGLGISSFVAVGNKADVSGNDLLRFWQDDPATDVVMLYLESFGNPVKFSRITRKLSRTKPVVAVKVGGQATESADDPSDLPEATVAAMLDQAGVIRVENLTQMFHTAGVLAHQPLPAGPGVAVVTNSWGPAWLAVDALLGWELTPVGPTDLSNEAGPDDFMKALTQAYEDPDVDAVLVIYAPGLHPRYAEVAAAIADAASTTRACTTVACLLGAHQRGLLEGAEARVPEFPFPEEAVMALNRIIRYAEWRRQPEGTTRVLDDDQQEEGRALASRLLEDGETDADGTRWLDPVEADELLAVAGLALATQEVVDGEDEVVAAARRIGYPVAIKATGRQVLTKTEAGGVSLDVHGDDEVRDAHRRMTAVLGKRMTPTVVQQMVPEGLDCRIALHRHPTLGDLVTMGPGGALGERLRDESMRILPLTDADAARLIDGSVLGELIDSMDGPARAGLTDVLLGLATLGDSIPEIVAVRLNPVMVTGSGAWITDARIGLRPYVPDDRPPVRRL